MSKSPHHGQSEGLLLHVLSAVKQDEGKNLHRLAQSHLVGQDASGPLHTGQGEFSDQAGESIVTMPCWWRSSEI